MLIRRMQDNSIKKLTKADKHKALELVELLRRAMRTGSAEGHGMKITGVHFVPAKSR